MWTAVIVAVIAAALMLGADAEFVQVMLGALVAGMFVIVTKMYFRLQRQAAWLLMLEKRLDEGRSQVLSDKAAETDKFVTPEGRAASATAEPAGIETHETAQASSSANYHRLHNTSAATADTSSFQKNVKPPANKKTVRSYGAIAADWVKQWLTTGNVPVKVGVLISFFGVSFLLKYAAEQNYLSFPVEWRLTGISAAAIGALVFGWRQRTQRPAFALSLQGGAIGVLFLTVFAAYQLYQLLPALVAFTLLVLFTVGAGVLAVRQNAVALAVLGVVGGFLAPLLISTDSGSHVALFSYYAILNSAVFGVAWFRTWRVLNVIGFAFTFVIGALWGYEFYQPDYFVSVQPFLALFFLMYLAISMAFAWGRAIHLRSYMDSTLVFGLPLVVFALQTQLVEHFNYGSAISALVLALVYCGAAFSLLRSALRERVSLLGEAFLAIGVGFATLAVPLALSAHWTAFAWALEGAGMVWLGTRQSRSLTASAGALLHLFASIAFVYSLAGAERTGDWLFANDVVLGGIVLAVAGVSSARWMEPFSHWFKNTGGVVCWLLFASGGMWWFAILGQDIVRVVSAAWQTTGWLLLLAATAALLMLLQKKLAWHKLQIMMSGYLPLLLLTALVSLELGDYYFASGGWFAWPAALAVHWLIATGRDNLLLKARPLLRSMTVWLLALVLGRDLFNSTDNMLSGETWPVAITLAGVVAMHWVVVALWRLSRFAVDVHANDWSLRGVGPVMAIGATVCMVYLFISTGDSVPLPYLPLLNPLSLAAMALALSAAHWLQIHQWLKKKWGSRDVQFWLWIGLGGFAFVLLTGDVARTVHQWAGVAYRAEALFDSVRFQASISVVWGLSALTVMVLGHRRALRFVYIAGAAFMAVVVAKLFLVDLAQSGTLERIVSFIGVGLLLLVVGFMAPVPPKPKHILAEGEEFDLELD